MPPKKVLIVWFSQSGQLTDILQRLVHRLQEDPSVELTWQALRPLTPYPFPWTARAFFGVFPESVKEIPCALEEPALVGGYDLVILGYQPWFLSPSIPIHSFLQSEAGRRALKGARVVTVVGCRNMWLCAQERLKQRISAAGGLLEGNIVLEDRAPNLISVVTILYWMLTGKRDRFLGLFPPPGVSRADVQAVERFGPPLLEALKNSRWEPLQAALCSLGAVRVHPQLAALETRARRIFEGWATFVLRAQAAPSRARRLLAFRVYLVAALFLASPLVWLLSTLALPLRRAKVQHQRAYFSGVRVTKRS